MLAAVLGWGLPCQSTPSLLRKQPKGRFGLHAIVDSFTPGQRTQGLVFNIRTNMTKVGMISNWLKIYFGNIVCKHWRILNWTILFMTRKYLLCGYILGRPERSEGDPNLFFSLLTHAKQLSLVTFFETTAGIRKKWKCDVQTDGWTDGRTDVRKDRQTWSLK